MEPLREAVEAWLQRVKAPILGYTLLASLAINWKPIWALIFSEIDLFSRFFYFDLKTNPSTLFAYPLLIGLVLAFLTPWIGLAGSYLVRMPARLQVQLQEDVRHQAALRKIKQQAEEEALREEAKIERAKRDVKAREVDPNFEKELRQSRANLDDPVGMNSDAISPKQKFLGRSQRPIPIFPDFIESELDGYKRIVPAATIQRLSVDLTGAAKELSEFDITSHDPNNGWSLTNKGYEIYDRFANN